MFGSGLHFGVTIIRGNILVYSDGGLDGVCNTLEKGSLSRVLCYVKMDV